MKKLNKNLTMTLRRKKIIYEEEEEKAEIVKGKKILRNILISIFILLDISCVAFGIIMNLDILPIPNVRFRQLLGIAVILGAFAFFGTIMFLKCNFNITNKKRFYESKDEEIDIRRKILREVLFALMLLMAPGCFVIASLIVLDIIMIPIQNDAFYNFIIVIATLVAIACLFGSVMVKYLFDIEKRKGRYDKEGRSNRHNKRR